MAFERQVGIEFAGRVRSAFPGGVLFGHAGWVNAARVVGILCCVLPLMAGRAAAQPAMVTRLVLPGIAADSTPGPGAAALAAAEATWANARIQDYEMSYTIRGWPLVFTFESTVRGGVPVATSEHCTLAGADAIPCPAGTGVFTVEGLFALIGRMLAGGAMTARPTEDGVSYVLVDYGANGVPVSIERGVRGVPDSESRHTVEIRVLSPAP